MVRVRERERQQRSRELGIKLAKARRQRAAEARHEQDLDARYVMLGAADYLREAADFQINAPIDDARVDPEERLN
jgi:hypothetical protein